MDVDDPDPSERRQSQRVRVNEVVQFEVGGKRVVGLLTVINEGGFFVTTRYFLNPGVVTKFEIDLPEAGRFLPVSCEVVLVNGPARYDWRLPIGMALRFVSMDELTRHIIDAFRTKARERFAE